MISARPDWPYGHNGLAIVLFDAGRYGEAEAAWDDALELDPAWTRPLNDRAIFYRRAGRFDDAREQLQLALEMDEAIPAVADIWTQAGSLERSRKRRKEWK